MRGRAFQAASRCMHIVAAPAARAAPSRLTGLTARPLLLSAGRATVWAWGRGGHQPSSLVGGSKGLHSSSEATVTKDVWARLASRSLLVVEGEDSIKFLQGLTTNDFTKLTALPSGRSMAGAFLNNQGRIVHDFIATLASPDKIYLDVCASKSEELQKLLKRYKLRAKVDVRSASGELEVVAAVGPNVGQWYVTATCTTTSGSRSAREGELLMQDPRLIDLGVRAIVPKGSAQAEEWRGEGWEEVSEDALDVFRVCRGVAQGPVELPGGSGMPLECNLEQFSGVAFNKGCYVGQELTARTHFRGQVRKRLMPFVLRGGGGSSEDAARFGCRGLLEEALGYGGKAPEVGAPVAWKGDKAKAIGKVVASTRGAGLAMVRLAHVQGHLGDEEGGVVVGEAQEGVLMLPPWWDKVVGDMAGGGGEGEEE